MYKFNCKACNTELTITSNSRMAGCGCDNLSFVQLDRHDQVCISGKDLDLIELVSKPQKQKPESKAIRV